MPTRATAPTAAAAARSAARPGGMQAAQRTARDSVDVQLQEELERARQRQVQGILSTFDR